MRTYPTAYKFYEQDEATKLASIGTWFRETGVIHNKVNYQHKGQFFVIGLANKYENYGEQVGLLYLPPVHRITYGVDKGQKWFKVGAFSPDDLDIDLEFIGEYTDKRQEIIKFLTDAPYGPWTNLSYRDMLSLINDHVGNVGIL